MAAHISQPDSDALYDLDLSFLDNLPEVTLGGQPPILHEPAVDFTSEHNDFDIASWAEQLEQQVSTEPDYTNFASWIPEFQRPAKPCDYCRSKRLDCYLRKGQTDCYACMSLFRECSLNSTTMEATNYASNAQGTFFDALHSVGEDTCIEQGTRATIRYLKSKHGELTTSQQDDTSGTSRRNGIRFPQAAVKTLRDWYQAHQDHPYPTEEEKASLEGITGLKPHQIANWLANQRRKSKVIAKTRPRRCVSPSARPATPAIDIVGNDKPWEELNPLERWQNSPPENEPAAFENIANAVASSDLPDGASTPSSCGVRRLKSSNGSGVSGRRAASTTSAETSQASSLSAPSSAARSNSSSHGSFGSFNSSLAGKRDRRRRKRAVPLRQSTEDKRRPFQCTFCTDTFKSKYDWTRHEKSLHVSLEKYICAPLGPCIIDTLTGTKVCVYCGTQNPENGHEDSHNHKACEEKGLDSRTFYRKDHLRQHLRLMHGCELTPSMETWKFTTTDINSRCGFCAQRFSSWQDRVDHLTGHFRAGTRMIDWKGCRGLDPAIAAIVTNAMPPYLIGIESLSLNPFSATNEASMREFDDILHDEAACEQAKISPSQRSPENLPPKATCWEVLTITLGKYANEMIRKGIVLTDEMLQSQARQILYGSDDPWNQTAADNPEWLDLFKKGHGLDLIPSTIGGQGQNVPEDLELFSDLGLRIPFFVQLEQYNKIQNDEALKNGTGGRARKEAETSIMMRDIFQQLTCEGLLHSSQILCPHATCSKNIIDCHFIDAEKQLRRRQSRWCNEAVTPANAGPLAKLIGLAKSGVPIAPEDDLGAARRAAKARAHCLEHLQWGEVECCPFKEQIDVLGDRRDAINARQAALRKSATPDGTVSPLRMENAADGSSYFPYHRHELSSDRARNYATITGPWEDSGKMPLSIPTGEDQVTTTGAMIEFLGPTLGQHLPFSNDLATSALAVPSVPVMHDDPMLTNDWNMLDSSPIPAGIEVSRTSTGLSATQMCGPTGATQDKNDNPKCSNDFSFDEMTFDGVFDLNMDVMR